VRLAAFKVKLKFKDSLVCDVKKPAGRARNDAEGVVRNREAFIERVRIPTEGTEEQRYLRLSQ